ncbi:MAG: DUF5723 family protein [Candidatus Cryptobacteroides sp.]
MNILTYADVTSKIAVLMNQNVARIVAHNKVQNEFNEESRAGSGQEPRGKMLRRGRFLGRRAAPVAAALLMSLFCGVQVTAQTRSTWMLDNNPYSQRLNPSRIPEKGFFSFAIGSFSPSVSSELGLRNLVFPTSQGLVTGFHESVSYDEFIGAMKKNNALGINLNENLFGVGFRGKHGGFTTIEVNLRADLDANLPRDIFAMLKRGGTGAYDLGATRMRASAYSEIAVGYARKLGRHLAFGARVKGLVGFANARVDVNKVVASSTADAVSLCADASIIASAPFLTFRTKASEYAGGSNNVIDFQSIEFDPSRIRPGGFGAAVDFGLTFIPVKDLEIGLAFNDLGAMGWQYDIVGLTESDVTYTGEKINLTGMVGSAAGAGNAGGSGSTSGAGTSGTKGSTSGAGTAGSSDTAGSLGAEMYAAMEALGRLTEVRLINESLTSMEMLPLNVNATIRYRLPFYRRLSVGAMASWLCRKGTSAGEFRAGATLTPVNWLSVTCNGGFSSFGVVWGSAFSINAGPLNVWAGFDGYTGSVAHWRSDDGRYSIPYPVGSFTLRPSFGLNFLFGRRVSELNR